MERATYGNWIFKNSIKLSIKLLIVILFCFTKNRKKYAQKEKEIDRAMKPLFNTDIYNFYLTFVEFMFLTGTHVQPRHNKSGKCGLTKQTGKKEKQFGEHLEISATIKLILCYSETPFHWLVN